MREVLQRVGLKFKTILGSIRGFSMKLFPIYLCVTRIWCLTVSLKREEMEIHLERNLLVPSVVRNIVVNAGGDGKLLLLWKRRP